MQRFHKFIQFVIFILIVSFAINYEYNPFQEGFIGQSVFLTLETNEEDPIYRKIVEVSEEINQDAEDAYIDRVWKKTPGLSGIRVNIDESYKNMKKKKEYDETLLVLDTVPPRISLSDLSAAPIYRGHPDKNMVSFLINVSWGTEYIPDILQTLKDHQVKGTFFIEGKWALENPNLVKMIFEQNHVIGNHAYSHPDMARISSEEIYKQINETNNVLQAIIEKKPKWFAPPSGSFTDQVVETAHQLEMETILWTVDTIDWKKPSVSVMLNRVLSKIHPGATILMHPTEPVTKGMSELISEIKQKGYRIGTIEQLLSPNRE